VEKLTTTGTIGKFVVISVGALAIGFGITAGFPELFVCCHVEMVIDRIVPSSHHLSY
jgi:hypothetical protein